jgi:hypothetical protein
MNTSVTASELGGKPRRILLIDLDNCPSQLTTLVDDLNQYDRIMACHGQVEPRIPLTLVPQIAQAMASGRVEFWGMSRGGKNAADFGLTFIAGRLSVEEPADSEYVVVSADSDLDHLVDLLQRLGRRVKRVNKSNDVPKSSAPATNRKSSSLPSATKVATTLPSSMMIDEAVEDFIESYLRSLKGRPHRKQGLRNLINMYFGKNSGIPGESVLEEIFARGYVTMNETGKLTYRLDQPMPPANGTEITHSELLHDAYEDDEDDEIPF